MIAIFQRVDHVDRIMAQWRTERPDLDPSPQGVIGRLHRVGGRLTERLVAVYARHGLDEGEFDILASLRRSGEPYALTPSALAASTMVTSGAISKRIDRCEQKGLVTREVRADDGRGRLVTLTPAGRRVIDGAFTEHIANEHTLVSALTVEERGHLAALLAKWAEALDV